MKSAAAPDIPNKPLVRSVEGRSGSPKALSGDWKGNLETLNLFLKLGPRPVWVTSTYWQILLAKDFPFISETTWSLLKVQRPNTVVLGTYGGEFRHFLGQAIFCWCYQTSHHFQISFQNIVLEILAKYHFGVQRNTFPIISLIFPKHLYSVLCHRSTRSKTTWQTASPTQATSARCWDRFQRGWGLILAKFSFKSALVILSFFPYALHTCKTLFPQTPVSHFHLNRNNVMLRKQRGRHWPSQSFHEWGAHQSNIHTLFSLE